MLTDAPNRIDVSVLIAAYNARRTVVEAISSACAQRDVNVEVLICDDASTDDTFELISEISDPRVRIFRNPKNIGPGPTRDLLIDASVGEFIAFLDADDRFVAGRLARIVRIARTHPDALVFDDIYECHDTPSGMRPFRMVHGRRAFRGASFADGSRIVSLEQLMRSKRLLIKPLIPRRQILATGVRHTPHRYGEDGLFLWRLVARGTSAIYLPDPLYCYRVTPGSLSSNRHRLTSLGDCLRHLLGEQLSDAARQGVRWRLVETDDLIAARAVPADTPFAKLSAALRYFLGNRSRFLNWLSGSIARLHYHLTRRVAGAPRR